MITSEPTADLPTFCWEGSFRARSTVCPSGRQGARQGRKRSGTMAKNGKSGDGHRNGAVRKRSQVHNPKTDQWVKRDTETGKFMDAKEGGDPFKGVTQEKGGS